MTRENDLENKEELTFELAAREIIAEGDKLMVENSKREGRIYHTKEHPDSLNKRLEKIAAPLGLTEEQKFFTRIPISWHDTVIIADRPKTDDVAETIIRHRGARDGDKPSGRAGNEAESARVMKEKMLALNEEAGREIFSGADINKAVFMVEATYPDVAFKKFKDYEYYNEAISQNPKAGEMIGWLESEKQNDGLLFFQPHLESPLEKGEEVPLEALVMVLDDLGGPGIATAEEFAIEGDKEFRELHANLIKPETLSRLRNGDEAKDDADRQKASEKMLGWLHTQSGFVAWQMLRIEKILYLLEKNGQLSPEKAEAVRGAFDQFENNIKAASGREKEARNKFSEIKGKDGGKAAFSYLMELMHL